ncbi:MAG: hypothetical protein VB142_07150 [Burkholderia sp.]
MPDSSATGIGWTTLAGETADRAYRGWWPEPHKRVGASRAAPKPSNTWAKVDTNPGQQREAQHGERIGQRPRTRAHCAVLAIVGQGLERARGLADRDQLPEHRIELARVMPHGFR